MAISTAFKSFGLFLVFLGLAIWMPDFVPANFNFEELSTNTKRIFQLGMIFIGFAFLAKPALIMLNEAN